MDYSIQEAVRATGKAQISATLEVTIPARKEPVFDFVAAEDVLPKVLTGYGLLPAVVRTSGNTGPWDRPQSVRTVHLADGNTAREQVTAYTRPKYFGLCTRIWINVHSRRLSGKRRIRSWWLPSAVPSAAGNRDRGSPGHDAGAL